MLVAIASFAVAALASAPYVIARRNAPSGMVFSGALVSAQDTNSYFAKMRQGFDGAWLFRLPYTVEPQRGIFFFTLYLGLGHVARILHASIITLFHLARYVGGVVLLLTLFRLIAALTDDPRARRWSFALASLGSGLGFYTLLFGHGASIDLTVPEANSFYSMMANPHFPLSAAAAVWGLLSVFRPGKHTMGRWAVIVVAGALLVQWSMVLAPGLWAALGTGLYIEYRRGRAGRAERFRPVALRGTALAGVTLAGVGVYFAIAQRDPVLAAWTAQNVTPSPPVWDYLLGAGALLPLALLGFWHTRDSDSVLPWALLGWLAAAAVLIYIPHPLQRRFAGGAGAPLGALAGLGLAALLRTSSRPRRLATVGAGGLLILPTNLMLVAALALAPARGGAYVYLSSDEAAALAWLGDNVTRSDVVLASPELGNFVPAHSAARVIYGHPFETIAAAQRKAEVAAYYASEMDEVAGWFVMNGITYVIVGPRERALGAHPPRLPADAFVVFESGSVRIYATAG